MQLPLNAFLLKTTSSPHAALVDLSECETHLALWNGERWELARREDLSLLAAARPGDIAAVFATRQRTPAMWQEFIRREIDLPTVGEQTAAHGAIVFCAVDDPAGKADIRWVCWCFGTASRSLQRSALDPRFGLTIALNVLASSPAENSARIPTQRVADKPQLSALRYRTTAPFFQQTGHRTRSRGIPVDGFRIDTASDLIAEIGGRADPTAFAASILGGRSLRFRRDLESLADLVQLSIELLELSTGSSYQAMFSWVDNIRVVEDDSIISQLQQQLVDDLRSNPIPARVDAILPDDMLEADDERAIRFVVYPRERRASVDRTTLTAEMLGELVAASSRAVTSSAVLNRELRFLDDSRQVIGRARLIDCICADMEFGSEQFLAYDGDFYQVDRSFVQRIDNELSQLEHSTLDFPPYSGGTEPDYADYVGTDRADQFVVLDRTLIRIEGESGIEASDLVARSGALIHLKRKGKSSKLSHLFLQVANSCELLRRSSVARSALSELINSKARSQALAEQIREAHESMLPGEGLEVVFAFLGEWRKRTVTSLPLFSRISLVQESRKVANLGYRPTVALIGALHGTNAAHAHN